MKKHYKRGDGTVVPEQRKDDKFWLNAWINNAGSVITIFLLIAGFISGYSVFKYQLEELNKDYEIDAIKIEAITKLVDKHEAIIPTIQQDVKDIKRGVVQINQNITQILMEVKK